MPRTKKAKKAVTAADVQAEETKSAAAAKRRKTANSAAAAADAVATASAGAGGATEAEPVKATKKPKKLTKKQLKAASAAAEEAANLAMLNHATAELKAGSAMTEESAAAAAKEKMDDAKLAAEMAAALAAAVASSSSSDAVDVKEPVAAAAAAAAASGEPKADPPGAAAAAAAAADEWDQDGTDAKDVKSAGKTLAQKLADIAAAKATAATAAEMTPEQKMGLLFDTSDDAKLGCWMPFERHVRRVQVMVEQTRVAQGGWKVKPIHFNFQESFFRELQGYVQQFMNGLIEKAVDLMVPMGGVQVMMKHIRVAMFQDTSPLGGTYRAMTLPITVHAFGGYDPRRPFRVDAKGEVTAIDHDAPYNSFDHPRARERIVDQFVDLLTTRSSTDKKDGESDYVDGLSSRSLRALSKMNAAQSMSHCCYDELRAIVTTFIWDAMVKITEIAAGANRKTIFVGDLVRASDKVWRTLLLTPEMLKKRKHADDDGESPTKKVKRGTDDSDASDAGAESEESSDDEDTDAEGEGENSDEKASDS